MNIIIPLIMSILLIILGSLLKFNLRGKKAFFKVLGIYGIGSFLIISCFALIYIKLYFVETHIAANLICSCKEETKYFKGVVNPIIDLFYFSAITFFTIGYGDITIKSSVYMLLPVIEGFLGIGMTGIFISLAITEFNKEKEYIEKTVKYSDRGWDVLFYKNKVCIFLINDKLETKEIYCGDISKDEFIMLEEMKYKWCFNEYSFLSEKMIRKFLIYIYKSTYYFDNRMLFQISKLAYSEALDKNAVINVLEEVERTFDLIAINKENKKINNFFSKIDIFFNPHRIFIYQKNDSFKRTIILEISKVIDILKKIKEHKSEDI